MMLKVRIVLPAMAVGLLFFTNSLSGQLRISEFLASSSGDTMLADEDGDHSDWIEIQNTSPTNVNLFDWALTDDREDLAKWKFPATNLPPNGLLVVFASNKDRRSPGAALHTNFKLEAAGEYLALVDPSGTNVLAEFDPFPPQVQNVSFGFATTASNLMAMGVYFTEPSPGIENLGGATEPGPGIAEVRHTPNIPGEGDTIWVSGRVFPTVRLVASVALHYRIMFGPVTTVQMLDDGAHGDGAAGDGVFGAAIPASAISTGQMVRYFVTALDSGGTMSRLPVFSDPAATAEYFGTVINPGYVTSSIPVVHLFAPASVLQPGPTTVQTGADSQAGGRVALYYDGEFYDNIEMQLRGNSTATYNKKSHRVEFNREHPFRHWGPGGRIRKTSFTADYADPTYMRQGLSFWLCNEIGAPAPFYDPVRLQLNGAFYQLANHNDVHGEELLDRLGYDRGGALYNAIGTIQPSMFSLGGWEKKTRRWDGNGDYTEMANSIAEWLSTDQRRTNLFERFDLPEVISYMVAARFAHENDDVWANMSLYHDNDGDDLWRIIPFDMNLSWGAAFLDSPVYGGIQSTNDSLKSFPMYGSSKAVPSVGGPWNRLYDAIFSVPQTREMFLRRMRSVLDEYVKPPGTPNSQVPLYRKITEWRDLIGVEAERDRAKWGWPAKYGQSNFDPGIHLTNGVDQLLADFLEARRAHFYIKHSVTNTALPIGIGKSDNAGIPLSQPGFSQVAIVGMDFNPASGNQDEEYVELKNPNPFAVDLSGWDLDGGIHFKFQPGTVVPSGMSLFVSPNVKAFRSRMAAPRGGQGLFVVGPYDGRLNARGETLILSRADGRLVSSNSYAGSPSPAQRYLRVTEIMYHPSRATEITPDEQQFEYVELKNISTNVSLDLAHVRFTAGIQFDFSSGTISSLAPLQTIVLVRNQTAFTERFGSGFSIAGEFQGALEDGGETLRLDDATGEKILEFAYNNRWYPITDGLGFSLVIVDEGASWNSWDSKSNWRASGVLNGSPGTEEPAPPPVGTIFINEILTHTDLPEVDAVELFNPGDTAVDIGGWFLTDDFFKPGKFRIPDGTVIPAGGYHVITENEFNTGSNAFRLSEYGEQIALFSADALGNLTGFVHGFEFGEAPNGVSFGWYTNSQTNAFFVLQSAVTLGASNSGPRVGPIIISEIMYHPPDQLEEDSSGYEFIELANTSSTNVLFYCPEAPTNTWRIRNAVDFDFPPAQTLAPGQHALVVGFDPDDAVQLGAFRSRYGISNAVPVYGPWSGKLDNSGETIELKQPDTPEPINGTLLTPYIMIDKVAYSDSAPWPAAADGIGNSLQRISNEAFGNDPANWLAAGISAGRDSIPNTPPKVSIHSPTNGSVIKFPGPVTVSVVASDPGGAVDVVQLFGDGVELARWSATASNYLWSAVAAGAHRLKARVTDNSGAVVETSEVGIVIVTPVPSVQLLNPTSNAIVVAGSTIPLSATGSSGGGLPDYVAYYLDDTLVGGAAAPFTLDWTAGPPGAHTISAVAIDSEGQQSASSAAPVFIQNSIWNPVVIPASAQWRYLDNGSDLGSSWIYPAYSDAAWPLGLAKFGFNQNNSGVSTVVNYGGDPQHKFVTYYFRKQFVAQTLSGMTNLLLEFQRDDGIAIYLNGQPLYRENLPSGVLSYAQLASNASDNGLDWHSVVLPLTGLRSGSNVLAVEVHQSSVSSSDLGFDLRLSLLGSLLGPAITLQPAGVVQTNGGPAVLAVTAIGEKPLAYRWTRDGTDVPGAITASLAWQTLTEDEGGDYRVIVSNLVGSTTSHVARVTVIAPDTDSDGDGMPDSWERNHGTNPGLDDASADADGDGHSNLQEYVSGTAPTNASSVLKIEPVIQSGSAQVWGFPAVSNHSYSIEMRTNLAAATWFNWREFSPAASNRILWFTNALDGPAFYRVVTPSHSD